MSMSPACCFADIAPRRGEKVLCQRLEHLRSQRQDLLVQVLEAACGSSSGAEEPAEENVVVGRLFGAGSEGQRVYGNPGEMGREDSIVLDGVLRDRNESHVDRDTRVFHVRGAEVVAVVDEVLE